MANKILWDAGLTSRGNVLSTELNSLSNGSVSAVGSNVSNVNDVNLDQYGMFELNVTFGSAPSSGGYVNIYETIAPDGTNYGSTDEAFTQMRFVCSIPLRANTAAQRLHSPMVMLRAAKAKYALENKSGVAFPASGSTLALFTANDEVQ